MPGNQSHHLIINSVPGNYTEGDTEGKDGVLAAEDVPSVVGCCAAWQCLGAQRTPLLLARLRE